MRARKKGKPIYSGNKGSALLKWKQEMAQEREKCLDIDRVIIINVTQI